MTITVSSPIALLVYLHALVPSRATAVGMAGGRAIYLYGIGQNAFAFVQYSLTFVTLTPWTFMHHLVCKYIAVYAEMIPAFPTGIPAALTDAFGHCLVEPGPCECCR